MTQLTGPEEVGPMPPSLSSLIVPLLNARVPAELRLEFPPPGEEPISEPYTAGLYVTYAVDRTWQGSGTYERVGRRQCAEAGLIPEALRRQAVANLRARRPDLALTRYPDAPAVAVTLGGNPAAGESATQGLESGLILDEGLMDKLAQDFLGDLVAVVPARDVLVVSGTGHPDGLAKLHWVVDQVWSVMAGPLLTRDLLVRRQGVWEPLLQ
jgi:uncharacterized protein YtpQ (UPF0354 family)